MLVSKKGEAKEDRPSLFTYSCPLLRFEAITSLAKKAAYNKLHPSSGTNYTESPHMAEISYPL